MEKIRKKYGFRVIPISYYLDSFNIGFANALSERILEDYKRSKMEIEAMNNKCTAMIFLGNKDSVLDVWRAKMSNTEVELSLMSQEGYKEGTKLGNNTALTNKIVK